MKFQQRDQFEQIQKWEQQMKDSGFVDSESEILKFLQEIDYNHQSNHSLASQLITLLALSMATKGGKESLVLAWMEKAIRLDPNNLRANQYVTNFDWERSMIFLMFWCFHRFEKPIIHKLKNKMFNFIFQSASNF